MSGNGSLIVSVTFFLVFKACRADVRTPKNHPPSLVPSVVNFSDNIELIHASTYRVMKATIAKRR